MKRKIKISMIIYDRVSTQNANEALASCCFAIVIALRVKETTTLYAVEKRLARSGLDKTIIINSSRSRIGAHKHCRKSLLFTFVVVVSFAIISFA
jgi:hypothetical protein